MKHRCPICSKPTDSEADKAQLMGQASALDLPPGFLVDRSRAEGVADAFQRRLAESLPL